MHHASPSSVSFCNVQMSFRTRMMAWKTFANANRNRSASKIAFGSEDDSRHVTERFQLKYLTPYICQLNLIQQSYWSLVMASKRPAWVVKDLADILGFGKYPPGEETCGSAPSLWYRWGYGLWSNLTRIRIANSPNAASKPSSGKIALYFQSEIPA